MAMAPSIKPHEPLWQFFCGFHIDLIFMSPALNVSTLKENRLLLSSQQRPLICLITQCLLG